MTPGRHEWRPAPAGASNSSSRASLGASMHAVAVSASDAPDRRSPTGRSIRMQPSSARGEKRDPGGEAVHRDNGSSNISVPPVGRSCSCGQKPWKTRFPCRRDAWRMSAFLHHKFYTGPKGSTGGCVWKVCLTSVLHEKLSKSARNLRTSIAHPTGIL